MGLALDEPKDGDEKHQIGELTVVADPFAMKIIKESGGITIRTGIFGPTAELEGARGGCGCDS